MARVAEGFREQVDYWRDVRDGDVVIPEGLREFAASINVRSEDRVRKLATLYVDAFQSAHVSLGHELVPPR